MTSIAQYLIKNYYGRYKKVGTPTLDALEHAIKMRFDKIVVIQHDKIEGVAVYLTLSDETFNELKNFKLEGDDLFTEQGRNVHFIILAADNGHVILQGIKEVIKKERPKTISWFNPDHTRLHTRRF